MIDAEGLTKRFGDKTAVDNLSFRVLPGMVTGFLGPNGAGKSTTMRLILGLDRPNSGRALVNGEAFVSSKAPMTLVGALLDGRSVHPGRTARSHLRALAATHGISTKRVDEVIGLVGLESVAGKRAGGFSLGMQQRLGLAGALLGDPEVLVLDEPVNGLDPEGVLWVRNLMRYLAGQGRTVLVSSHLMSEMALSADRVVIIGRGHLLADTAMSDLIQRASGVVTKVRSPNNVTQIAEAATSRGYAVESTEPGVVTIKGWSAASVGEEAAYQGWVLHELTSVQRALEDVYMELTDSSVEFQVSDRPSGAEPKAVTSSPGVVGQQSAPREFVPADQLAAIAEHNPANAARGDAELPSDGRDEAGPPDDEPAAKPRRAWVEE